MRRAIVLCVIWVLAASAVPLRPALAADDQVVVTVAATYVPPVVAVAVGQGLDIDNPDVLPHNVTARDTGADGRPLFASPTVGALGGHGDVVGVELLDAGGYAFYCTLHPWMNGVLEVGAAGAPSLPGPSDPGVGAVTVGAVVPTPTSITVHGESLYAASFATGTVYALPLLEGGLLGPASPYATGFSSPLGIVFDDAGTLYVSDSHESTRSDRSTAGRVWSIPAGGGAAAEVGSVVIDELPNGRHNTNGLAVHGGRW